ncbi:MAG: DAK2 domain-containing protein [Actinomycetes bacterium]
MPPLRELDVDAVRAWATAGRDALEAAREEIDELNVYPVPDGDTGTNLHLTVASAVEAGAAVDDDAGLTDLLSALAHGALLGARGNSGVILSQVLRGLADSLGPGPADGETMTKALGHAADAAYAAVARPVEGTMLTVARAAAEAAGGADGDLAAVVVAAADGARAALARTPEQLEVLRQAGVVDAGGRGVCVLLDALQGVVTGVVPTSDADQAADGRPVRERIPARDRAARAAGRTGPGGSDGEPHSGPGYEVMYLLDAAAGTIPSLREALDPLGDSLVVVGAEPTWNVHVHVDDVGAAIEAGIAAGRPYRIKVTNFRAEALEAGQAVPDGRGVVSVVAGSGLGTLFEASGATVVAGGPGRRASMGELLDGLRRAGARDLIVLPNDADSLAVAEAAASRARDDGLRVAVIPTTASVQALAALAVHDDGRRFEDDVVHMTAAAGHCRHGGVTVAARESVTMAGVCHEGDVLGIVDGDFVLIGDDLGRVACTVVDRMLGSGGELVTLVTGADALSDLPQAVVDHLRRSRPEVDTVVYEGGQPRYPLLIGVE